MEGMNVDREERESEEVDSAPHLHQWSRLALVPWKGPHRDRPWTCVHACDVWFCDYAHMRNYIKSGTTSTPAWAITWRPTQNTCFLNFLRLLIYYLGLKMWTYFLFSLSFSLSPYISLDCILLFFLFYSCLLVSSPSISSLMFRCNCVSYSNYFLSIFS